MPAGPIFPLVPLPTPPAPEPPTPIPQPTRALINPAPWPYRITSVFGDPREYGGHEGIDLAPTSKTGPYPVVASAAGEVLDAGWDTTGYGYFVRIGHGSGVETLYGHLSDMPLVAKGDKITQGQAIGNAGNTGNSSGTHLHFSVLVDGNYLDPVKAIYDAAYATVKDALENVSDAARAVLQADPCAARADIYEAWRVCRKEKNLPSDETAWNALFRDLPLDVYTEIVGLPANAFQPVGFQPDSGVLGFLNAAKKSVINGVTWPLRAMINAFQLSDTPLLDGAQTVAWLQEPENQRLYIASQVALLLIVLLLIIALAMFLREPSQTIIENAVPIAGAVL